MRLHENQPGTASSIDNLSRSLRHEFTDMKKNYQKILNQVLKITTKLWTKTYEILKYRVFALREKCTH